MTAIKSRLEEIDALIEKLTRELSQPNGFTLTELEFSLITIKAKREKVNTLAAVAKSQVLLADMDILIAESDLRSDLERVNNYYQKLKLEYLAGKKHGTGNETPVSTKKKSKSKSSSSHASKSSSPKRRKKSKSSSETRKITPADISSDETVIIEALPENRIEIEENLHDCLTQLPKAQSPAQSDISLPSFIKAEFNNPYEETDNQTHKKISSKGKSSASKHHSPKSKEKTRAISDKTDLGSKSNKSKHLSNPHTPKSGQQKSDDRKPTPTTCTYVPIRHNMPMIVTQTKNYYGTGTTAVKSPSQNIATSDNAHKLPPSPNLFIFGSKQ